jgi:hypothetical protein
MHDGRLNAGVDFAAGAGKLAALAVTHQYTHALHQKRPT